MDVADIDGWNTVFFLIVIIFNIDFIVIIIELRYKLPVKMMMDSGWKGNQINSIRGKSLLESWGTIFLSD